MKEVADGCTVEKVASEESNSRSEADCKVNERYLVESVKAYSQSNKTNSPRKSGRVEKGTRRR